MQLDTPPLTTVLYLLLCAVETHGGIPRSLQQQGEGLAPSNAHAGVYHLLHQHRTLGLQHLQDVQVDGEEVGVQHTQQCLVTPLSKLRLLQ